MHWAEGNAPLKSSSGIFSQSAASFPSAHALAAGGSTVRGGARGLADFGSTLCRRCTWYTPARG